jgi:hypothetical protein
MLSTKTPILTIQSTEPSTFNGVIYVKYMKLNAIIRLSGLGLPSSPWDDFDITLTYKRNILSFRCDLLSSCEIESAKADGVKVLYYTILDEADLIKEDYLSHKV